MLIFPLLVLFPLGSPSRVLFHPLSLPIYLSFDPFYALSRALPPLLLPPTNAYPPWPFPTGGDGACWTTRINAKKGYIHPFVSCPVLHSNLL